MYKCDVCGAKHRKINFYMVSDVMLGENESLKSGLKKGHYYYCDNPACIETMQGKFKGLTALDGVYHGVNEVKS